MASSSAAKEDDIPETMRAWTYSARGLPRSVLKLATLPTPPPPTGKDILVRVSHAAINPDGPLMMGFFPNILFSRKPRIPELEFSGTVVTAGPSVPFSISPGTEVVGWFQPLPYDAIWAGKGALAEYVLVSSESVIVKPPEVKFEEAAGMTGVGQTAAKLLKVAAVQAGMRVLINGGSTGVGTMTIQLCKLRGAYVVATCSGKNRELVKGLGADEIIDYREEHPLWKYLSKEYKGRPFDAILDTAGTQALFEHSSAYLKEEGAFVNIGAFEGTLKTFSNAIYNWFWPKLLGGVPRKYFFHSTMADRQVEEDLMELLRKGSIKVEIEKIYPMEDALDAYDKILSRSAKGKQIVKIQSL